jgi:histidine triad (HIT) family protein
VSFKGGIIVELGRLGDPEATRSAGFSGRSAPVRALLSLDATRRRRVFFAHAMTTIFEKIIAGEIPATIVHQDDRVTAFRDISPQAPVHVLIVPNKPIPTVNDVSDEDERTLGHMFIVARDIARAEGIADNGFRLIVNCNQHGGQVVFHLHMHLLGGAPLGPMLSGGKHG